MFTAQTQQPIVGIRLNTALIEQRDVGGEGLVHVAALLQRWWRQWWLVFTEHGGHGWIGEEGGILEERGGRPVVHLGGHVVSLARVVNVMVGWVLRCIGVFQGVVVVVLAVCLVQGIRNVCWDMRWFHAGCGVWRVGRRVDRGHRGGERGVGDVLTVGVGDVGGVGGTQIFAAVVGIGWQVWISLGVDGLVSGSGRLGRRHRHTAGKGIGAFQPIWLLLLLLQPVTGGV